MLRQPALTAKRTMTRAGDVNDGLDRGAAIRERLPCGGYSTPPAWHIDAVGGSSLIAARPSRPECCPARVMVLSAVSRAAATSGPVRRTGIARSTTGLRVPTAPTAQLPAPSPEGDTLVLNAWGRDLGALRWHRLRGPAERLPGSPLCAGGPPTCAPRRRAPCPDRSAARWLWPRSSSVAVVSHGEGSRSRLRTSVCGQVRRRIWKCVRYDRSRLTGIGAASARGGQPRLEIERSDWAPQRS